MSWLTIALIFVGCNFLIYTLIFRHLRAFSTERVIFLYQVLSFTALPLLLFFFGPPVTDFLASLVAAVSLHAIYSLSFLEVWSLSEGSYSLRMVDRVEKMGIMPEETDTSDLEKIGASKKSVRLGSVIKLGLATKQAGTYRLTAVGHVAVLPLRFLVWLANIRGRIG